MTDRFNRLGAALLLATAGAVAAAGPTCRDDIPASAPDSRFTDNGDGTVTDAATGLMWKQCAEGLRGAGCAQGTAFTFDWQLALKRAATVSFAGFQDWRLPNINELESLVEQRCYEPAINARYFPNIPAGYFWSASSNANLPDYAWYVYFYPGSVGHYDKSLDGRARLVRGGQ